MKRTLSLIAALLITVSSAGTVSADRIAQKSSDFVQAECSAADAQTPPLLNLTV